MVYMKELGPDLGALTTPYWGTVMEVQLPKD